MRKKCKAGKKTALSLFFGLHSCCRAELMVTAPSKKHNMLSRSSLKANRKSCQDGAAEALRCR